MKFTLIVCTYQRPLPLLKLLDSVAEQTLYPDQILIIDGSRDMQTNKVIKEKPIPNLEYFKVEENFRGLTNQRNFGINKVAATSEIICFLDDDIVLTPSYFEKLINTYQVFPDAVGVGGYIIEDLNWEKLENGKAPTFTEFWFDGYKRKDSSRFLLRKKLGLMPDTSPTYMPPGGHGRSVGFLPPSGKIYKVETFMGGVSSYRKEIFDQFRFSSFFDGYGLYEDTDFTLRLSQWGNLYLNTSARLHHFHEEDGRPNRFKYGKMVVRNGWYVWRIKNPKPKFESKIKWHLVTLILILVRLSNIANTNQKKQALTESVGRIIGWWSIILNKPKERKP